MSDPFEIGGKKYEIPASAKARSLDMRVLETRRKLGTLEGILAKLEHLIPENRTLAKMDAGQLGAARMEITNARELWNEIDAHMNDSYQVGEPLVDTPELPERAQDVAYEKLTALSEQYRLAGKRIKAIARRLAIDPAP